MLDSTIWQPGEVVDTQTDLSQFSFSVPHAVRPYAFFVQPRYIRSNMDDIVYGSRGYEAGNKAFGMIQWQRLRIGLLADFSAFKLERTDSALAGEVTLMASYFWPWISFGLDAGAGRATLDQPTDAYMLRLGATFSIFGNKWAVDAVLRAYGSVADDPYRGMDGGTTRRSFALARWRYDLNYRWRFVVFGKFQTYYFDDNEYGSTTTARLRVGTLQLIAGARFRRQNFESTAYWSRSMIVTLPLSLVLEHGSWLFYVGASGPFWRESDSAILGREKHWIIKFEPKLGCVWRITPASYFGVQLAQFSYLNNVGPGYSQIQLSFQFTHNLAPFGYDDEIPVSETFAHMSR